MSQSIQIVYLYAKTNPFGDNFIQHPFWKYSRNCPIKQVIWYNRITKARITNTQSFINHLSYTLRGIAFTPLLNQITFENLDRSLIICISKPSQPAILREDLILKMLAGELVKPKVLQEELERHRRLHLDALAKFQGMEKHYLDNGEPLAPEKKLRYLAVRRGIRYEQDWLNWCDEALKIIEELEFF